MLEIYNEILRDLLSDPKSFKKGLEIRHGKEGPQVSVSERRIDIGLIRVRVRVRIVNLFRNG